MRIRHAILLFGVVNASLYSALLPLWEGFDEPYHYGYVETLWQTKRLLVLGPTQLPSDVFASFRVAPVSYVVSRWIPGTIYSDWFVLSQTEKERRRSELDGLRSDPGTGAHTNFEAHQPPLAYLILAPVDASISRASIGTRVFVLRLFAGIASVVLLFCGATALCRTLELPESFTTAALFTIFCSQMLYATVAHVANDWLAVGISAMFLAALADFAKKPDRHSALRSGAWLTAGLLTKAYFLVFALLAAGVVATLLWQHRTQVKTVLAGAGLVLLAASPWYLRNLYLYGNIPGTQEALDGIGIRQVVNIIPRMDWWAVSVFLARGALWTGNNSFGTFSRTTINAMLAFLLIALVMWIGQAWLNPRLNHARPIQPAEQVIFAAIVLFSAAVGYASAASFIDRSGDVPGASPWYTQVLLVPVVALAYLAMSRWKRVGLILVVCNVAVWTWVLIATWTIKLFPTYAAGYSNPMRVHDVWDWYTHNAAAHNRDLTLLALAPAPLLYVGLLASVTLSIVLAVSVIRSLYSSPRL